MSVVQTVESKDRVVTSRITAKPKVDAESSLHTDLLTRIEEWKRASPESVPELPKVHLTNEEFLKLLQSAPDFEIPDRHAERLKRRRVRTA